MGEDYLGRLEGPGRAAPDDSPVPPTGLGRLATAAGATPEAEGAAGASASGASTRLAPRGSQVIGSTSSCSLCSYVSRFRSFPPARSFFR